MLFPTLKNKFDVNKKNSGGGGGVEFCFLEKQFFLIFMLFMCVVYMVIYMVFYVSSVYIYIYIYLSRYKMFIALVLYCTYLCRCNSACH